ncbi:MAG: arsenite efflux transporter metallochaperone ArsD [Lachnospiraceae bacterium]|nr:arsenite efflux transporter metallochaperone ArsD [Lachnospiraceae bacterium]
MKKLQIFEPAMCCNTGFSGVGVDTELIRISAVIKALAKREIKLDRFNLSKEPQEFINHAEVNKYVNTVGIDKLPVTTLDGKIVLEGRYPSNEEIAEYLELPIEALGEKPKILGVSIES